MLQAQSKSPLYLDSLQMQWVDSVYLQMNMDERLGQLFMVAAYTNKGATHEREIAQLISKESIGGLIFMQDDAVRQIQLTNQWQTLSKVPLLIGMDAEWDLSMRLKNTNKFPWAMTMGAVTDSDLIQRMGSKVAQHLGRVGGHFNFAPVADVNVNPKNPIIGNRSYGSNPGNVAQKAWAYAQGMQQHQIMASAKHFPGHGDTDKDSHKTLPTIPHTLERLKEIELAPFQSLIDQGITAIMVAHLNVPALEKNPKVPASLSYSIVTNLLKEQMGFEGIIITDALNMKGVTDHFPNGESDYMAFKAGNDILLFSQAVASGKKRILEAIRRGDLSEARIEESVKKILMAKYWSGLHMVNYLSDTRLSEDLNDLESIAITQEIFEEAITLVQNQDSLLPIASLENRKFGWLKLEEAEGDHFYQMLRRYAPIDALDPSITSNVELLKTYDVIFISLHKDNSSPYKSFDISRQSRNLINNIAQHTQVVLSVFGSPYALNTIDDTHIKSVLVGYQNHDFAMSAAAQVIFGAIPAKGVLPVDVNEKYKYGSCIETQAIGRLGYTQPENVGMSSAILAQIDQIAQDAINVSATPGMQILAVRDGKVFYDKSFGYTDYSRQKKIEWDHLYDVASITKIVGTMPLVMEKYEEGLLSDFTKLEEIEPKVSFSNKKGLTLKEVLAHQAGLYAWIPFHRLTLDSITNEYKPGFYNEASTGNFTSPVARNLFIDSGYQEQMIDEIMRKENISKNYRYSDLGYYILKKYLENQYNNTLDKILDERYFSPIGMNFTQYNPWQNFPLTQIAPTEQDPIFRKQLVHGYVHDQGAALLGGIAGHAGLFSNANDLAKFMQMLLNGGAYGGQQFLDSQTIDKFTQYQFPRNRRGLGFDKQRGDSGPTCKCVSDRSYGHTGFTGTMVWADPDQKIVYVFLSNRVHPSADNRKLNSMEIRERVQEKIYQAIQTRY